MKGIEKKQNADENSLFKMIIEQSNFIILKMSLQGIISYVSPSIFISLGYQPSEVLGLHFKNFIVSEDLSKVVKAFKAVISGRQILSLETEIKKKDGQGLAFLLNSSLLYEEAKPKELIVFLQNINDLKIAQLELLKSEKKMRHIIEQGLNAVLNVNSKGKITYASENVKNIIGHKSSGIVGRLISEILPISEAKIFKSAFDGLKKDTPIIDLEIKIKRKDGAISNILINSGPEIFENKEKLFTLYLQDITKRKQVEIKMAESEELFRGAFNNSATGMALVSVSGHFVQTNNSFRKMLGYNEAELSKKSCFDLTPNEDLPKDTELKNQILLGKKNAYLGEKRYKHKNGNIVWTYASFSLIKDDNGAPKYFIVQIQDITEEKAAEAKRQKIEEQLQASEARYRSYIEITGQIGWVTTPNGLVEDMPVWRKYTGQTIEEIKGWGWLNAIHADDRVRTTAIWKKAVATKSLYETEYRIRRADGVYRYFIARGVPSFNKDGSIKEWVGTCIDITDRKKAEDEMRLNSEIIKNISEGVYLVRLSDGIIVYTNPKFESMFGYKPGEMIGKHAFIVNAPAGKNPKETAGEIMDILEKTGQWSGEINNIKKNGMTFWCYANCSLLSHPEYGKVIVAVHTDITERKKAEKKTKDQYEELKKMNELMVGRELKMIELKEKIKKLEK